MRFERIALCAKHDDLTVIHRTLPLIKEKKKRGGKECAIHSNSVYHTEIRENENLDRTFLPAYVASRISVSYHID